jgi:hypothetical protein
MVPAIDHSKKDGGMYIFPESNAGIKACVEIEYHRTCRKFAFA